MAGAQYSASYEGMSSLICFIHMSCLLFCLCLKYDRIDPAEVQALKEQIEALTAAKAELEQANGTQHETDHQRVRQSP